MLYSCEKAKVTLFGTARNSGGSNTVVLIDTDDFTLDAPLQIPNQSRTNEVIEYVRGDDVGLCDRGNVVYDLSFTMVREEADRLTALQQLHAKMKALEELEVSQISIEYKDDLGATILNTLYNAVLDDATSIYGDDLENARQWGMEYSLTLSNLTIS